MRPFRERLQDILDAIAKVEGEQAKGREAFVTSPLIQVWMVHHLMIIGEAVRSNFQSGVLGVKARSLAARSSSACHLALG